MSEQLDRRTGWIDNLARHWGRPDEAVETAHEPLAIFSILQKMAARIRSDTPLSELLSTMAMNVCHALSVEIALIRVLDPEQETLSVQGLYGVPPHLVGSVLGERTNATETFRNLRPGSLITFTPDRPLVLQHASALVTDEIQSLNKLGAVHILVLPLHHRGHLLGRLDLLRLRNEPFTVEDGTIANVLATLIAGVIFGPPEQEEAERYDRIIDASFAFQQSIEPLANVGEMLQNTVESIRRLIRCDRCYGLLWGESRREFAPAAVSGADGELVDRLKQISLSPTMIPALGQLFTSDRPLMISSAEHPELLPPAVAEALGAHTVVLVPLQGRREPLVGALMLDCTSSEHQFSNRDLAVLSIIAPHAAMMVENALLFEEVKRSSERLALVNDIGIELASLTDLAGLFSQVHHHVASVLNASRFCMGLVLPDGESVEYRYAVNDEIAEHPLVLRLGDDPLSQAIRTKQPLMVNNRDPLDSSIWFPPMPDIAPSDAMLVVPILVGQRSIGVITAQSESRGAYTKHDLDLLATIGMQTGVAIENARLYTMVQARVERRAYLLDQVLTRQEAERKTIAEDIHNDTLQTLASCLYSIDLIGRRATQLSPEETQSELRGVRDNLAENIDRLRQIIFQIRPSTLDILGLEPALREHAKYVENDTGIEITLDVDLDERPSSDMETAIYRIAQETMAHMRHRAGVSHIVVRIRQRGETIIVTIADNGEPLPPEGIRDAQGDADDARLGETEVRLITLKERIELAGGQLHTASLPNGGATLQIILPNRSAS